MTDLIARLEAATEGSKELDKAINRALATDPEKVWTGPGYWYDDSCQPGQGHRFLPYTTSIDAALTLVPDGWHTSVNTEGHCKLFPSMPTSEPEYTEWREDVDPFSLKWFFGAATPALALCIAALKARNHSSAATG